MSKNVIFGAFWAKLDLNVTISKHITLLVILVMCDMSN